MCIVLCMCILYRCVYCICMCVLYICVYVWVYMYVLCICAYCVFSVYVLCTCVHMCIMCVHVHGCVCVLCTCVYCIHVVCAWMGVYVLRRGHVVVEAQIPRPQSWPQGLWLSILRASQTDSSEGPRLPGALGFLRSTMATA